MLTVRVLGHASLAHIQRSEAQCNDLIKQSMTTAYRPLPATEGTQLNRADEIIWGRNRHFNSWSIHNTTQTTRAYNNGYR